LVPCLRRYPNDGEKVNPESVVYSTTKSQVLPRTAGSSMGAVIAYGSARRQESEWESYWALNSSEEEWMIHKVEL
jgi:hypothetical protein